ncbi:MAG: sugar transferase [Anaerolineae bacterium]|nr:sugar transferase [Anaerolineae bacterium]
MNTSVVTTNNQARSAAYSPVGIISKIRSNSRNKFRVIQAFLLVIDVLMILLAFGFAYNVRFIGPTTNFFDPTGIADLETYTRIMFFLVPMWMILFFFFRLYDPAVLFGGLQEYAGIFNGCTAGFLLIILAGYLDPSLVLARAWLIIAWVVAVLLLLIERFVFRRFVYWLRQHGHFMSPAYIVGANAEGIAIAEQLLNTSASGINIIGFLDDTINPGEEILPGIVVHGSTNRAEILVERFGIERLIVATSGIHRENMVDLFRRFVNSEHVSMWLSSGIYEILTTGVQVQDVGSVPMVSVNRVRLTGLNIFLKAVMDYVGASLGLLALSPIFLMIAIIMKFTDPGPIIYRRRVVGVGGKEFDAFKFRTMVVNSQEVLNQLLERDPVAREEWNKFYKLKKDPRITPIGAFLRKTSIDELPQLLNVLRGEMSIVGPRMITMEEVEKYGKWGLNLQTVKPGITGLWQISGRSELTYEERVRLDMNYIRNYSIWLDLQIVVQTIPSVLMSKGAY